jgi:arsenical pump membrane protein
VLALVVLAVTLTAAVMRPPRLPEWLAATAGALILLVSGATSWHAARAAVGDLGSTVGFLAALLVLAEGCRRRGVFDALAQWLAAGSRGRPSRLFALVFAAATAVTVVLGLDPAVVLVSPIVITTARGLGASPKPPLYAVGHLSNSASLLLPISNLTNLLAFHAARISFVHFGILMALPWAAAVAVEWFILRRFFAGELATADFPEAAAPPQARATRLEPQTRYALVVLGLTLLAFALSSAVAVAPIWVAVAGAALMLVPELEEGRPAGLLPDLVRAAAPGFLLFVFGLGVIVRAAGDAGLHSAVVALLPTGASLGDLLLVAAISALAANLLNNLPATLILVPVAAAFGLGPLLAVLIGVGIGPNLTFGGSLATLLWRRIIHPEPVEISVGEFSRLGLLTVLPGLPAAAAAVWLSVRLFG